MATKTRTKFQRTERHICGIRTRAPQPPQPVGAQDYRRKQTAFLPEPTQRRSNRVLAIDPNQLNNDAERSSRPLQKRIC